MLKNLAVDASRSPTAPSSKLSNIADHIAMIQQKQSDLSISHCDQAAISVAP
jgi:phosphopantetheinyl transferase (holo-ACP synthase)